MLRRFVTITLALAICAWLATSGSPTAAGADKPDTKKAETKKPEAKKAETKKAEAGKAKESTKCEEKKSPASHKSGWEEHGWAHRGWHDGHGWRDGFHGRGGFSWHGGPGWRQGPWAHDGFGFRGEHPWARFGMGQGSQWWGGHGRGECPCPYCQQEFSRPWMRGSWMHGRSFGPSGGRGFDGWGGHRFGWGGRGFGSWGPGMCGPGFGFHRGVWKWGEGKSDFRGPRMAIPSADELFKRFDIDKNGSISKEEFEAGLKKLHERIREHMAPQHEAGKGPAPSMNGPMAGGMGPMGRGGMGPGGMGPMGRGGMGPGGGKEAGPQRRGPNVSEMFERFDKNKDGKITKDEVPAPLWERMLSRADANKDGAVTKDELEAFHKQMQERFGQMRKEGPGKKAPEKPEASPKK